jgi:hypothetical protein
MADTFFLAPTADIPPPKRGSVDYPPAYAPCETCGVKVLRGHTATGARVVLEPDTIVTYVMVWRNGEPEPEYARSGGHPVHTCTQPPQPPRKGKKS